METCSLRDLFPSDETPRVSAGQQTRRERDMARDVLTACSICRIVGPTARLREHLAVDHERLPFPIVVWAEGA